jgi:uncharacterized protein
MVMKLDNEFTVGVPVSAAWDVLTDLELIAPCMPGAQLTGVNEGVYTGKVKIKVGPVTAEYAGTAQFTEKDDASYVAVINARGRDSRGNGNATAIISAQLRAVGDSTVVNVTTDLTIAGRIAQFGSGMIKEVSAKLLGQFVECLEGRLGGDLTTTAGTARQGAGASGGVAGAAGPAAGAVGQPATAPGADAATSTAGRSARPATEPVGGAASVVAAGPEAAALDLMSVAGRAIYKRLIPVVVAVVVIAVIIYLVVR